MKRKYPIGTLIYSPIRGFGIVKDYALKDIIRNYDCYVIHWFDGWSDSGYRESSLINGIEEFENKTK